MKKLLPLMMIAVVMFASSCKKEDLPTAAEALPATWNTSDGGTITFNSNYTGTTSGSEFFEVDLGNGPIEDFTWSLSSDDNLTMEFEDGSSSASLEFPVEVKAKDEVFVGVDAGFINISVTLTK